jgi:hypothetical protein
MLAALAVLGTACGGGNTSAAISSAASTTDVVAPPTDPGSAPGSSVMVRAADASGSTWAPPSCDAIPQEALSDVLGGTVVVGSGSRSDRIAVTCEFQATTANNSLNDLYVQLPMSIVDGFLGLTASQEGTGTREYVTVPGFDEGRLYGDSILIAQIGGRAIEIAVEHVFPPPTVDQMRDVAQAILTSPPADEATTTEAPSTEVLAATSGTAGGGGAGLEGRWNGTFASAKFAGLTGTFTLDFTVSGITLAGTVEIDSDCVSTGTVDGQVTGSDITFGVVKGSETVSFSGSVSGPVMHGEYHAGPACGDDNGTWTANRD